MWPCASSFARMQDGTRRASSPVVSSLYGGVNFTRMWPRRCHNPMELARIAVRGVVLFLVTLTAAGLLPRSAYARMRPVHPGWEAWCLVVLTTLIFVLPGVVIKARALSLLNEGVRLERWSDRDLAALRAAVDKPVWRMLSWLIPAGLALVLLLSPRHSIFTSAWCFTWIPMSLIYELRTLTKPDAPGPSLLASAGKPLHSEHWGHRA